MRLPHRAFQKILDEVHMKGNALKVSLVALGLSAFLTAGAQHAAAQGPAGAGASEAAKSSSVSAHSMNPIKWIKKEKKSADANALLAAHTPKRLVLHFVRDVESKDLKEAWEEGFEHNAKAQMPALKERIEQLQAWMVDMKSGQQLTFTHTPGAGLEVDVNGTVQGTVEGEDFAKAFFSIWLGAKPPHWALKAGLLGGSCDKTTRGFGRR